MNLCTPVYYAYSVRSLSLSFVTEVFELRQSGEIWQIGRSEFQTDGAMKLKKRSPKDFKLLQGICKSFSLEDRRVRDVSYVQSEDER